MYQRGNLIEAAQQLHVLQGFIAVEVNESEIAELVAGGYLPEEARGDPVAIKGAIEVVISGKCEQIRRLRDWKARTS